MNSTLAKKIFIMGAKYRNPSLWPEYDRLKESEWYSSSRLKELQLERLILFLEFAEKNSPYYKKLFRRCDFSVSGVSSIDDLKNIPAISKNELIEHSKSIHTDYKFRKEFLAETSGTTGSGLEFKKNENWDSVNRASMMRAYDWYDVKPWDRHGYFWGYNISLQHATKAKVLDYFQNRFRIFTYDKEMVEVFSRKLSSAIYVAGYSSMIYEVAKLINDLNMKKPILKLVKGTSEMILDVYQVEAKKAFGRKIASEYGAAESGLIAFECPEGSMHINVEDVLVEVDENNEIIVTNLVSYSYPVIRYKLGDVVTLSDEMCGCGRAHPIIKEIIGRKGASVVGWQNIYPALTFYYVFKNLAIEKSVLLNYKAVQKRKGLVDISIEGMVNVRHEDILIEELMKYFSNDVSFNIMFVNGFDSNNKKTQYFESYINLI